MIAAAAGPAADRVEVVLLDPETDAPIGTMDKLEAHRKGLYHTALSVILLDGEGKQILQRRATGKYHGAGLWANACCSHPLPGELLGDAVKRRLFEELGVALRALPIGTIRYRAAVVGPQNRPEDPTLIENEHVSVYAARCTGVLAPDPDEISQVARVAGPRFVAPGPVAPWYALYMRTFGARVPTLLAAAEAGTLTPPDFGSFDLLEPSA